jgi:hypothetical protein
MRTKFKSAQNIFYDDSDAAYEYLDDGIERLNTMINVLVGKHNAAKLGINE